LTFYPLFLGTKNNQQVAGTLAMESVAHIEVIDQILVIDVALD
jgi:hypothetical protein